jgi:hypothetical protein
VVLLGDSIFDNHAYVHPQPAVIEQLRQVLPAGWDATLLAVDGSVTANVPDQLQRLPPDATHLVISSGGNDALRNSGLLTQPARSAAEVFLALAAARERFDQDYSAMLTQVLAYAKPTVLCTIYDPHYPDAVRQRMAVAGLAVFNDGISRAAARFRLPLLDLRVVFNAAADYANPIEPSAVGGRKLVERLRDVVLEHAFARPRAVLYA